MKTNFILGNRFSIYMISGLVAFLLLSCSSFQNSSYYEGDGIYSSAGKPNNKNNSQSNKYQEYFNDLNRELEKSEIITNVNTYSTTINDSIAQNNEGYNSNPGWGSN
ncbi:MAG: hypothetical protein ABUL44_01870, partial [Flavobacterium sp.]